jgi:hypothetical protein
MDESGMLCVKLDLVNRIDMDGSNSKTWMNIKKINEICHISNLQNKK